MPGPLCANGSCSGRPSASARSIARKPGGSWPSGIFSYVQLRRRAGLALLRDGAEAVVRRDEDVGAGVEPELLQRRHDGREIVVRDLDGGERGRPVDAGSELVEAVELRVLRAVRIGRPVEQHERLALLLVVRQQHLGDDVAIVFLLDDVGRSCRDLVRLRAAGGFQRQARLLQHLDHVRPQLDAVLLAGVVVEEDRGLAVELGQVMDADRPDLAEPRREVALLARELPSASARRRNCRHGAGSARSAPRLSWMNGVTVPDALATGKPV